jgi:predicted transglutaminase-like cysteine proteinase
MLTKFKLQDTQHTEHLKDIVSVVLNQTARIIESSKFKIQEQIEWEKVLRSFNLTEWKDTIHGISNKHINQQFKPFSKSQVWGIQEEVWNLCNKSYPEEHRCKYQLQFQVQSIYKLYIGASNIFN